MMPQIPHAIVSFAAIERLRDDRFRIGNLALEPRSDYDHATRIWRSPNGTVLQEIAVETGWFRLYFSSAEKCFWLMEIEGPDHGVHFYGPFAEAELPGTFSPLG